MELKGVLSCNRSKPWNRQSHQVPLAREGCAVGLMARTEDTLSETARACRQLGSTVFALPIDLESPMAAGRRSKTIDA